ncbi:MULTISPECIES: c-type cytochrome [unclassified Haematospirillum]|uniref:c-type cytochrome n=1 Tax=unclassified Haematospirillum TaxID=2622088 RepID=UPI00143C7C68|nr:MULTISPECIES: cytochrome c [unclassified Haematospirillum]NKD54541.1 cytochrome c [Haematospirillum sp. H4890]NKD74847.1 cytochrome c [Haematospirillum sp. H4485]NKD88056.1 cytochrome c [Haematospirillum sp. 15-248]
MHAIKSMALVTSCLLALPICAQAGEKETIKYRENNMEIIGSHMNSIVAIIKEQVPHKEHLATHASGLSAAAKMSSAAFKEKTSGGDTTAKDTIWSDSAKFDEAMQMMLTSTAKLETAAASGDMSAVQAAVGDVGKSCKNCHDTFRNKK